MLNIHSKTGWSAAPIAAIGRLVRTGVNGTYFLWSNNLQPNPVPIYSEVNSIELNGAYSQETVHRISALEYNPKGLVSLWNKCRSD